ncbi:MAG: cytochrome-c peroxidase [Pseudomonadota bacterium]
MPMTPRNPHYLLLTAVIVVLSACKHPLAIEGEGDIVDLNGSAHGCTLEEFQVQDVACTDNEVLTDYNVHYAAVPRAGWRFVRWENGCLADSTGDNCIISIPAAVVTQFDLDFPGLQLPALTAVFELLEAGVLDLDNLPIYANQEIPSYIQEDNTGNNQITDEGATLGRVLFYDRQLSVNNTIACASCHQQDTAFSDPAVVSAGVNGQTGRHSMRLINARFAAERRMFWDERANSVEDQSTQPIQDHVEMGFSGEEGDPDIDDLIARMEGLDYYPTLFETAFGTATITENRMRLAIAQFVRSIQSFDSRYDEGLALNGGDEDATFPNFSALEEQGRQLYMTNPRFNNASVRTGGGLGCNRCHRAPEFDISPGSDNNGVISVVGSDVLTDLSITRSPSLRDLVDPQGQPNGPMMHDGSMATVADVLAHYNDIALNDNLDNRLRGDSPGNTGTGQQLNLTPQETSAVEAFLLTLAGNNVYTDERWSNPFDDEGNLVLIGGE